MLVNFFLFLYTHHCYFNIILFACCIVHADHLVATTKSTYELSAVQYCDENGCELVDLNRDQVKEKERNLLREGAFAP